MSRAGGAGSQVGASAMDSSWMRIDTAAKSVKSSSCSSILAFQAASDPDHKVKSHE